MCELWPVCSFPALSVALTTILYFPLFWRIQLKAQSTQQLLERRSLMLAIHNYGSDNNNNNNSDRMKNLLQPRMTNWLDSEGEDDRNKSNYDRLLSTLAAIRKRAWKEKWPLVTEVELKSTGPWHLKPYEYHNHSFWPWTTGIEMLARSRFGRVEECNLLLSKLTSESNLHMHTFYEWVNSITDEGNGAFPFRTGIAAVRISIIDTLSNIERKLSAKGPKRLTKKS
jgi:hypothetical protein